MNKKFLVLALAGAITALPMYALAATFGGGENYYLDPNQTINDNLYAGGTAVGVAGTVNGDLMVVGGNILITGNISGDVAAAGGDININSAVAGDIRAAGGNITISKSTGGDLMVAGGQINILPDFSAGKDVEIAGGNINFLGGASGSLDVKGGSVYINGPVAGNLTVTAQEINLGPKAAISGNFYYSSSKTAALEQGAVVAGETKFNQINLPEKGEIVSAGRVAAVAAGFVSIAWILKTIMIIAAALILVYAFRQPTSDVLSRSPNFWKEALRGFIVLVVLPIAIIISFITVVGMLAGIIALFFYIALISLASVFSILLFASLCLKYVFKKPEYQLNWWVVIISAIVFSLISVIPFIGWIVAFMIFLSALGSVSAIIFNRLKI